MTTRWRTLRVESCADRDAVLDALFAAGSQGVHEDADALVTHLPYDTDFDSVVAALAAADPSVQVLIRETPPMDWSEWRASVGAHIVGSLTVAPPWLAGDSDPATTIVIDPATAFGTGEHPTTRGMLRLMQNHLRAGDVVADLGAGSAVLAIAAAKLGASRVIAIELDDGAEGNATDNISANHAGDVVSYMVGDATILLPLVAPVRVVLANIVSSVLMEILPSLAAALRRDGVALLSGILTDERDMMAAALDRAGLTVIDEDVEGDWLTLAASPRG